MNNQHTIKGNWLALAGTLWYLLEFPVMITFWKAPPLAGSAVSEITAYYAANRLNSSLVALGMAAATLGLLAFIVGLRHALRNVESVRPLLDLAFAASVIAIAGEIARENVGAMAAQMAAYGPEPAILAAAAFHTAAAALGKTNAVATGLFTVAAALAILRTPTFPRWAGWIGLVGGIAWNVTIPSDLLPGGSPPALEVVTTAGWLLWVVWMLATGIILARRAR